MSKISKTKNPPTGGQACRSSLLDALTALGACLCSLVRPSQTHRSLASDALHRASPDAERLGHLHTLREQPSHLAFGLAVYLRPAEPVNFSARHRGTRQPSAWVQLRLSNSTR
jgi:hypothetical protein